MNPEPRDVKEPYEKPEMQVEQIELATVAGQYGHGSIDQLQPFFGLCAPCIPQ
jgi:hypothetical protein